MKIRLVRYWAILSLSAIAGVSAYCQESFQNLDFESANIPPGTPFGSVVSASNALPSWSVTTPVGYEFFSIGGAFTSVIDTDFGGFAPLQGQYSALLFGGEGGPTTLSQTGTVPIGTKSLQVDLAGPDVSLLIVSVNGQTIQLSPLATFANYTQYGGDIASFAGQVTTLGFTEQPPAGVPPSFLELDDIQFSVSPVPEPATLALFATGALLLAFRRKHKSIP